MHEYFLNEQYKKIFNLSKDGIIVVNREGKIIDVNKILRNWSGYQKKDLASRNILKISFFSEESRAVIAKNFSLIKKGVNVPRYELEVFIKNGQKKKIFIRGLSIKSKDKIIGFIFTISNITEYSEIEKQLDKSKATYASLAKSFLNVVIVKDGNRTKIVSIDKRVVKILGGIKNDYLGIDIFSFVYPNDSEDIRRKLEQIFIHGKEEIITEMRLIGANKKIVFFEIVGIKIKIGGQPAMFAFLRDITKYKETGKKLRQSLIRQTALTNLYAIFDKNIDFGKKINYALKLIGEFMELSRVYVIENPRNVRNAKNIYEWRDKAIKFQKYKSQNVLFNKFLRRQIKQGLFCSANIERLPKNISKFFFSRNIKAVVLLPIFIKGSLFGLIGFDECKYSRKWDESEINPLKIASMIFTNAFSKAAAEEDLKNSEEKLRALVNNIPSYIILVDRHGIISFINKFLPFFTKKRIIGKSIYNFIPSEQADKYKKIIATVFQKKKTVSHDIKVPGVIGGDKWFKAYVAPIKRDDEIKEAVIIALDITELKKVEEMKVEFVSMASHQLRTPLTGLKWLIEILSNGKISKISSMQKKVLEKITLSNERMILLVNDLLDVSRIESGKGFTINKRKIKPNKVIEEILIENTPVIKEKCLIIKNNISHDLVVMADREKIKQIFDNLISNAIKYSDKRGNIKINCHKDKEFYIFSVKDDGIGISKAQQQKIFNKFFRADNATGIDRSGSGLGLYIAKSIIERHGGRVWFKSTLNKGSIFYFSLQ